MNRAWLLGVVVCWACVGDSSTSDGGTDSSVDAPNDATTADVGVDASMDVTQDGTDAPVTCSSSKPFNTPTPISGYATGAWEGASRLSQDELTMWFEAGGGSYTSGTGLENLFVTTRASISDNWVTPATKLGIDATLGSSSMLNASVTGDGLTLFFTYWGQVSGQSRIWFASRASTLSDFSSPAALSGVATTQATASDAQPLISPDGSQLWFNSNRSGGAGGQDIYVASKGAGGFGAPTSVTELESAYDDMFATPSNDGLTIYFSSTRASNGTGATDIYVATRTTTTNPFSTPTAVSELNSGTVDFPTWLSPDECRLYISTTRINGDSFDLFVAERTP